MPIADFIIPCYNEQDNIYPLHAAFKEAFSDTEVTWNLIFIDDGSTDATFNAITDLASVNNNIVGIQFSRNFGKEAAILAGIEASTADYIGIIDADLQQSPLVAFQMLEELLDNSEYDCIAAYQENRNEGFLLSHIKNSFYKVFAQASRSNVIAGASDFRIFKRVVAEAIMSVPEYHRFSKGIFAWVGFKTLPFPYTPQKRASGTSKWSFRSLLQYAFEGLLSFTTRPLKFITFLGIAVCLIALVYFLILFIKTVIQGIDTPGYASIVGLILLMGGGQFLALGIFGEYIARTYIQVKNRPVYLVRERTDRKGNLN